jgi:hypothetical protein
MLLQPNVLREKDAKLLAALDLAFEFLDHAFERTEFKAAKRIPRHSTDSAVSVRVDAALVHRPFAPLPGSGVGAGS